MKNKNENKKFKLKLNLKHLFRIDIIKKGSSKKKFEIHKHNHLRRNRRISFA